MADFRPFRGWHYNAEKVNFEQVLAPPYDIISEDEQEELYSKSDFNCIRLILNQILDSDNDTENRYTRARDFFQKWCQEGILAQEGKPSFYLYQQIFKDPETSEERNRSSLLGKLKLEPFENRVVIPHENTLSGPKKDRTKLLETTQANLSPIFGLYEDPEQTLVPIYNDVSNEKPLFSVTDKEGIRHALWVVGDDTKIKTIQDVFRDRKIYIADGHHRYQTSLDYGLKQRAEQGVQPGEELGSDFGLVALVEFNDPGLALFPTHRLIKSFDGASKVAWNAQEPQSVLESLKEVFEVSSIDRAELEEKLRESKEAVAFGIAFKTQTFFLKAKDLEKIKSLMPDEKAPIWYGLDVNIIPHCILNSCWGMDESLWESTIGYTHSTPEAFRRASEGTAQAVFILKAPKVELLRDMGEARELMAQKSTYFYPKLASGLVFHQHQASQKISS